MYFWWYVLKVSKNRKDLSKVFICTKKEQKYFLVSALNVDLGYSSLRNRHRAENKRRVLNRHVLCSK